MGEAGRCEPSWVASRTCSVSQLEVRCRWCGRSSCSDGRIFGTLAGLRPDGCIMAACLHVCPLGTLELEGVTTAARANLDHHLFGPLVYGAWHTILLLHHTLRDMETAGRYFSRGETPYLFRRNRDLGTISTPGHPAVQLPLAVSLTLPAATSPAPSRASRPRPPSRCTCTAAAASPPSSLPTSST